MVQVSLALSNPDGSSELAPVVLYDIMTIRQWTLLTRCVAVQQSA